MAWAWEREATVIHPPIDVARFADAQPTDETDAAVAGLPPEYLLGVSRFVPYKRLELVIEAGAVSGLPVVLAGGGADEGRLRAYAEERGHAVTFVRDPSSTLLAALYRNALALVFPAVEDFGIMPVEAMATGTPVVGNAFGGVSESVVDGVTGALVHDWSGTDLADAVERAIASSREACVQRAFEFDRPVFEARIAQWVAEETA